MVNLTVTATNTAGQRASSPPRAVAITVNPVAEAPSLAVTAANGNEGSPIPLSINAAQVEGDLATANLTVNVSGLQGGSLNQGKLNGDGSYKLTAGQLAGLTFTPVPEATGTIVLTVSATDTEPSSGTQASSAAQPLAVVVNPVAEAPSLAVTAANGNEGSPIPLSINTMQVEGDLATANLSITVTGLQGGTLNNGTPTSNGYTLSAAQLTGLTYTPAPEFTAPVNLLVTATDTEPSSNTAAMAETPWLSVAAASGNEDTAIPLLINAAQFETDLATANLSITVTGLQGGSLNQGTPIGNGYTLSAAELTGLTYTPAPESTAPVNLLVTATDTEPSSNTSASSATKTLAVTVNPVAETPSLSVAAASGNEDTAIPLSINAAQVESDLATTNLSITVTGLQGGSLNQGTLNGDGSYTLAATDLTSLTFTPKAGFTGTVDLLVTATDTEPSSGTSATTPTPQTLAVTVNPTIQVVPPILVVPAPQVFFGPTTLESTSSAGVQSNSDTGFGFAFSPDSKELAFSNLGSNLVPGDTNGSYDIFVKDLATGTITRVSTDSNGGQANGSSFDPAFSPDGTEIAFASSASNLVPGDTNGVEDTFVKNLITGAITRVSTDSNGAQGQPFASFSSVTGASFGASFSPDGTEVAFYSLASNLAPGETVGPNVFIKNLTTGVTTYVAPDNNSLNWSYFGEVPSFSPDGTELLFDSNADLVSESNGFEQIYEKNLATGAVTLISTDANGIVGNGESYNPTFSPDGTEVAFQSTASNLVPGDTNNVSDVFVKNLLTGAITRVSTDANGGQANNDSIVTGGGGAVFSHDGTEIIFTSGASNLVPSDTNGVADVFVKNIVTGAIARISTGANDLQATGGSTDAIFSPNGTELVFFSEADNLVPNDNNSGPNFFGSDAFVRSVTAEAVTNENTPITLSGITATLAPSDSSDTLSLSLNVQHGSLALSSDTGLTVTSYGSNGTLILDGLQADVSAALAGGVIYTPAAGYESGDLLTATATATASDGATATSPVQTLAIAITPSAEAPSLAGTATSVTVGENSTVPVNIVLMPQDSDDLVSLTVTGLPDGTTLSAGTNNGNGSWTLTPAQLAGLKLDAGAATSVTTYSYGTPFDFPGGSNTQGLSLNDLGQIVGTYNAGQGPHGYLLSGGVYTTIDDPNEAYSTAHDGTVASDINNSGEIVGYYGDSGNRAHGFIYQNGTYTTLDYGGQANFGDVAFGVNNLGQIVGVFSDLSSTQHGFLYSHGAFTPITDPFATSGSFLGTDAAGINDAGQIVGYYEDANGYNHGFLDINGSYTTLDDPNAVGSRGGTVAYGINIAGQITGFYWDNIGLHQFVYFNGTYTTLDDPSAVILPGGFQQGAGTDAAKINNLGQLIGSVYTGGSSVHGVLATPQATLTVTATNSEGGGASSTANIALTINPVTAVAPTLAVPAPQEILGAVTLVSGNASGAEANGYTEHPTYSQDGTEVAFYSYATNLVAGATNGEIQLYVKNLTTGAISRASSNASEVASNPNTFDPDNTSQVIMFSPDGTQIVFSSNATNLVPGITSGTSEVYIKNLTTGAISLVSASARAAWQRMAGRTLLSVAISIISASHRMGPKSRSIPLHPIWCRAKRTAAIRFFSKI